MSTNQHGSTGPRTPEGKARSSRNALKHGLTARELVIAPEDREAFASFLAEFEQDLRPESMLEQVLFNQLVHAAWNLRRIRILEAELVVKGEDPLLSAYRAESVERLARYASRAESSFHRSLRELRALQTARLLRETAAVGCQGTPPLADTRVLTKRTPPAAPEPRLSSKLPSADPLPRLSPSVSPPLLDLAG